MSARPTRLHYTGRHGESILGVPRRNLDERDIRRLSDDQLRDATTPHPVTGKALYVEPKAPKKAEEPKAKPEAKADEPKAEAKAE